MSLERDAEVVRRVGVVDAAGDGRADRSRAEDLVPAGPVEPSMLVLIESWVRFS
jgi:hypothetical protein